MVFGRINGSHYFISVQGMGLAFLSFKFSKLFPGVFSWKEEPHLLFRALVTNGISWRLNAIVYPLVGSKECQSFWKFGRTWGWIRCHHASYCVSGSNRMEITSSSSFGILYRRWIPLRWRWKGCSSIFIGIVLILITLLFTAWRCHCTKRWRMSSG